MSLIHQFGNFEIDVSTRELRTNGRPVDIEPKVFDLLAYLLANRDRAVSKDEILEKIWPRQVVSETALSRAIMKARRAVADDSTQQAVIRTLHGHGFRFVAPVRSDGPTKGDDVAAVSTVEDRPLPPRRRTAALTVLAVAALVVAGVAWYWQRGPLFASDDGTLAVLPVYSSDADAGWVRVGLMSLMSKMLEEGGIDVVPDRLVLGAVGSTSFGESPDPDQFEYLRQQTGADAVLQTRLDFDRGLHRISTVLTHANGERTRRIIVGESPAAIAADMASVIAGIIAGEAGDSGPRFSIVSTDPFVNELYARALDLELRGEIAEAREMFRVASAEAPELFWLRYEIALCTRDLEEFDDAERQFVELLEEAESGQDARALVATLNSYGRMKLALNEYADADALFDRAMAAAGERSLAAERIVILINQALVDSWQGNDNAAGSHYEDAVAAYDEAGRQPDAYFHNNYAGLLTRLGDLSRAKTHAERAVESFRLRGQRRYEAPATNRLAKIERRLGDTDRAVALHHQAMAIYEDLGDTKGVLSVMSALTTVYREQGDYSRARLNARNVIERSSELENYAIGNADAYIQAAYVEANAGEHEKAIEHFEQAATLFAGINEQRGLRATRMGIAQARIELADAAAARELGRLMLREAGDDKAAAARANWIIGHAELADRNHEAARNAFMLAYDYARLNEDGPVIAQAGAGLAEVFLAEKDLVAARQHVEEVRPHAGRDHDFRRLDARLAKAEGRSSQALGIMTDLRNEAGEGWTPDDDALLQELREEDSRHANSD